MWGEILSLWLTLGLLIGVVELIVWWLR